MATATASTARAHSGETDYGSLKILLPYLLAIAVQLPMLFLYYKGLWGKPHYQSFPFAIIVTLALAIMRWPYESELPFHKSAFSNVLLFLGIGAAILGALFAEPWFAAFSVLMLTTSLLAMTFDPVSETSLWTCALPLFVFMMLPNNFDATIITRLQALSAQFTSQLLDLIGLGHYMDGVVINVPGVNQYGIEEACSGVVSFFTLLAVTMAFVVWARRIVVPHPAGIVLLLTLAAILVVVDLLTWEKLGLLTILAVGIALIACIGFRAGLLLMSAVFWALFMNTVRIFVIPVADVNLGINLSHGFWHAILGYSVLLAGILLILSTDQFLNFFFGPVEEGNEDAGRLNRSITTFWNSFLSGKRDTDNRRRKKKIKVRQPVSATGRSLIWVAAAIIVVCGLFQAFFVQQSLANPQYNVSFFGGDDVTMDFVRDDMPEAIGDHWTYIPESYKSDTRSRGADLGERSDSWWYAAPRYQAVVSLDQTFPGWHELTTCYQNQGWKLLERKRISPEVAEGETPWSYIEAHFEKETGEKAFLLFSLFDAFGEPVYAPQRWATLNSFMIRARNRLGHRVRASLFEGEAYQNQVLIQSFNEIDEEVTQEVTEAYLNAREILQETFKAKRAKKEAEEI